MAAGMSRTTSQLLRIGVDRTIIGGLMILGSWSPIAGQSSTGSSPAEPAATVFRNVNVIPMDRERVEPAQTVVVDRGQIVAIGATAELPIPKAAMVIDGTGRYLLPGLTDAHVHLESWAASRPDFGDAPLYLAHGVTSVINLRGTATFSDWKRRVQAGELPGPTIYTAGELVIGPHGPTLRRESGEVVVGPNATTPEDVEREIGRQAAAGVDVIKYYGGLSRSAYLRMNQAARERGLPVVGHRPLNLGYEELLEARQSLAHVYMLTNLYFWPLYSSRGYLLASGATFAVVLLLVATWWRPAAPAVSRARTLTQGLLFACVVALFALFDGFVLDLLELESNTLLAVFIVIAVLAAAATIGLVVIVARSWSHHDLSVPARARMVLAATAGLALTCVLMSFWVPMSWRMTQSGIDRLALDLREAGISVQTTLIAFQGLTSGPREFRSSQADPAIDLLAPGVREDWRRLPVPDAPMVSPRAFAFMKRVTGTLHRSGVQLLAGTDALGAPFVVPGTSLHHEFQLLVESGLTPYEVIRAATINPARFLGREEEFGTVAPGRRADLMLVESNPLESLATLREPLGVMVRGRWLAREELQQMVSALRAKD